MRSFYELTTAGRARRLRRLALNLLDHYDLDVCRLRLMSNEFNGVFRLDTAGKTPYVVRVMRPGERTDEEIAAQAIWLAELGRLGLSVSYPLPNRDGDLVTRAEAPGVPEPRQGMLCTWVPGVSLGHRLTPANVVKQGELMAQMHAYAAAYTLPEDFAVKVYDCLYPYNEPWVLGDPAYLAPLDDAERDRVHHTIPLVEAALARLSASRRPMRLLHGDLHQWNVLISRNKVYAIDFDDLLLGHPVQDIGISLFYYRRRPDYAEIVAAFQEGYSSVLPWPEACPDEVETWVTGRALALLNVSLWSQDPDDRQYIRYCVDHLMASSSAL
jgi:Ser/Thr protein kinase RdoA (MazF antagonist)